MTFISGTPFHQAEAIQEEEESDGGMRKISNTNSVTITPATPSRDHETFGSSPDHPGSGQSMHGKNSNVGGRNTPSSGRNTPASGRNTPGSGIKTSPHRNGSSKVRFKDKV